MADIYKNFKNQIMPNVAKDAEHWNSLTCPAWNKLNQSPGKNIWQYLLGLNICLFLTSDCTPIFHAIPCPVLRSLFHRWSSFPSRVCGLKHKFQSQIARLHIVAPPYLVGWLRVSYPRVSHVDKMISVFAHCLWILSSTWWREWRVLTPS